MYWLTLGWFLQKISYRTTVSTSFLFASITLLTKQASQPQTRSIESRKTTQLKLTHLFLQDVATEVCELHAARPRRAVEGVVEIPLVEGEASSGLVVGAAVCQRGLDSGDGLGRQNCSKVCKRRREDIVGWYKR